MLSPGMVARSNTAFRRSEKRIMAHVDATFERRILSSLRRIVQAIDLYSRQLVAECEVTAPQLVCLHMLSLDGRMTSKGLAEKVRLDPSTVAGILDRLEAKGLVVRKRDQSDRRVVLVDLTKRGATFVAKAPSPLQSALAGGIRKLPRQEQRRLASALEEVVDLMQAGTMDEIPVLASSRFARGSHKKAVKPPGGSRRSS